MPQDTHETAPTQFAEAGGIRFAYRRFGRRGGTPLLLLGYFTHQWPQESGRCRERRLYATFTSLQAIQRRLDTGPISVRAKLPKVLATWRTCIGVALNVPMAGRAPMFAASGLHGG
jgi:hypothetical protein